MVNTRVIRGSALSLTGSFATMAQPSSTYGTLTVLRYVHLGKLMQRNAVLLFQMLITIAEVSMLGARRTVVTGDAEMIPTSALPHIVSTTMLTLT